ANPRLADNGDDLTTAHPCQLQGMFYLLNLMPPPDEPGQSPLHRNLKMALERPQPGYLVCVLRRPQPFDLQGAQRPQLKVAFDQQSSLLAHRDRARWGDCLQPRRKVCGMADRRVFGMASGMDFTHHHLARIHTDSSLKQCMSFGLKLCGVLAESLLHRDG